MLVFGFVGLVLGWLRVFRLANFSFALRGDAKYVTIIIAVLTLHAFLFGGYFILYRYGFVSGTGEETKQFSALPILGLGAGFVAGEVLRHYYIRVRGPGSAGNGVELLNRMAAFFVPPSKNFRRLDPEIQAAIEICGAIYRTHGAQHRRLTISLNDEFSVPQGKRPDVFAALYRQRAAFRGLQSSASRVNRKFGKGSAANAEFFERIAKIGALSGIKISNSDDRISRLAKHLGLMAEKKSEILARANKHFRKYQENTGQRSRTRSHKNADKSTGSYSYQGYYSSNSSSDSSSRKSSRPPPTQPPVRSPRDGSLAVLGLSPGASEADIKRAYRQLAKTYHPDVMQSQNASEKQIREGRDKMRQINAAYEWLEDN
jgi:DnaJ-domain-containing protein 1